MDLIFIALNQPDDDTLLNEDLFFDKCDKEDILYECKFIEEENFSNLLNFIFQTEVEVDYKQLKNRKLMNLFKYKGKHLHPNNLGKEYFRWLDISKNENTMNEYGSLICVLGYLESNKNKNELYLIVE